MATDGSPLGRGDRGRVDLLALLLTAALCSASYCLGLWHKSHGRPAVGVGGSDGARGRPELAS